MVRTDEEMGSCLPTADEDKLAKDVQAAMARRLCHKPIIAITTTEEESDLDAADKKPLRQRKPLKSDKLHTADSVVLTKATGPHELVYMAMGQPAVSASLAIMEMVKPALKPITARHLKELMAMLRCIGGHQCGFTMLSGFNR